MVHPCWRKHIDRVGLESERVISSLLSLLPSCGSQLPVCASNLLEPYSQISFFSELPWSRCFIAGRVNNTEAHVLGHWRQALAQPCQSSLQHSVPPLHLPGETEFSLREECSPSTFGYSDDRIGLWSSFDIRDLWAGNSIGYKGGGQTLMGE